MKLKHFSHKHPLILDEEQKGRFCNGCSKANIVGPSYSCSKVGCDFNLHKSCAELTPEIVQHPLHTEHPLILLATPQPHRMCLCRVSPCLCTFVCYCDNCGEKLKGFDYNCSLCKFDLCVGCAIPKLLNNIDHKSHKHPLIPLTRKASLLCDACGTKDEGFFYACPTCFKFHSQFFIHMDCALLPTTIKHNGHDDHILNLSYSLPREYFNCAPECKICFKGSFDKYWVYYCGGCRYFVHVNCAMTTTTTEKMETSQIIEPFMRILEPSYEIDNKDEAFIHLPVPDSMSLVSHLLKNMKIEESTQREKTIELDHFSHEHPLTLCDVQRDEELCGGSKLSPVSEITGDDICSGCIQRISNSPFYSCAQCKYFLHKCCAELPTMVQHLCHPQHSLILVAKAPTSLRLFMCECCERYCNGFAYHCATCKIYLDVKCGLLPSAITHDAHPHHILQLRKLSYHSFYRCKLCNNRCDNQFVIKCTSCDFSMHVRCALLPSSIRHKYDNLHPLTLTYSPIKDHPQEYICEVCENEFYLSISFYHCIDCDQSIHTDCTLGGEDFCNVKFGGNVNISQHEHQLTLVHKTKKPSLCDLCREGIKCDFVFHSDSTLECLECDFSRHLVCPLLKGVIQSEHALIHRGGNMLRHGANWL